MFICLNCLIDKYLALQIRMNPNTDEAGGCEESEDEESSESSSLDANMLRSKFASLASTLQQTNQNLVTFEYLLENNKKVRKLTESPKVGGGGEAEEGMGGGGSSGAMNTAHTSTHNYQTEPVYSRS